MGSPDGTTVDLSPSRSTCSRSTASGSRTHTGFVTRTGGSGDRAFYARWPEQRLDESRAVAAFERFGLPTRVD
jgi:hypothetical protein